MLGKVLFFIKISRFSVAKRSERPMCDVRLYHYIFTYSRKRDNNRRVPSDHNAPGVEAAKFDILSFHLTVLISSLHPLLVAGLRSDDFYKAPHSRRIRYFGLAHTATPDLQYRLAISQTYYPRNVPSSPTPMRVTPRPLGGSIPKDALRLFTTHNWRVHGYFRLLSFGQIKQQDLVYRPYFWTNSSRP